MARGKIRLAIICSEFNSEITGRMLKSAMLHAKKLGAEVKVVCRVPGAYEIPFATDRLLSQKGIDAAVALGTVIKGETKHDEAITAAICKSLLDISLSRKKPIGLGISGPGITWGQAKARIGDYARRSVEAAIRMANSG
ncbi:MAG: 6,7-dimethyl-8-ribityllumazine synthase [Candidatus Micrarchaeia archaeon]